MKKLRIKKIIFLFLLLLLLLGVFIWLFYQKSLNGYSVYKENYTSSIASSLAVFNYNESQHQDIVSACWYDSGDYVVFLQRNAEALFYLSLAYKQAEDTQIRQDLLNVIKQQLVCAESMISKNIKQFRDKDNHGFNLPPVLNKIWYPNRTYYLKDNEGKDIFLMLALVYQNIGDKEKEVIYKNLANTKQTETVSENCCEMGPLKLSFEEISALKYLVEPKGTYSPLNTWGVQFEALAVLQSGNIDAVRGVLEYVQDNFDNSGNPFLYIGGNYDIAGTVALEKLYEKQSGDKTFSTLADKLWNYLYGENKYGINFANSDYIYHPCYFFKKCQFSDVLINGAYKKGDIDIKSWQVAEVQLPGQAQYILAEVLYLQGQ